MELGDAPGWKIEPMRREEAAAIRMAEMAEWSAFLSVWEHIVDDELGYVATSMALLVDAVADAGFKIERVQK